MQHSVFISGLAGGLGLIVAIGAQNVFILRQALRREHIGVVVAVCAISDVALICLGTAGLDSLIQAWPHAMPWMTRGGQVFLLGYGGLAARRAWRPAADSISAATPVQRGEPHRPSPAWRTTALQAAAFSWLNPHAWLDTTVLLGSLAQAHPQELRWTFATGAACGSVLWFVSLGTLAMYWAPWFQSPQRWQTVDATVAVTMVVLAASLGSGTT